MTRLVLCLLVASPGASRPVAAQPVASSCQLSWVVDVPVIA